MPVKARSIQLLITALLLLYPLLVLLLVRLVEPVWLVLALLAALVARLLIGGRSAPVSMIIASATAIIAIAVMSAFDQALSLRLYPVFMNAAMLVAFSATLIWPPTMIERFARIFEPDLPAEGVRYTRKVTFVWCGFFVLNVLVSLWTALYGSMQVWAFYNGFIAYILMALLFAGEYLVRQAVRKT
ncbi:hypothetical protein [Henriciella sp.]|uniref:COG4648 family protein n=1 Tax=Henriciella sp. TaxID=1968823 RepID=UPI0026039CD8|nr:hypothetical protein [Henriciella sp.]